MGLSDEERDALLNGPYAVEAERPYGLYLDGACVGQIELTDADVLAVLLREVADAAFRAGVKANEAMPTIAGLRAAREKHVEEVIARWRSASSDKP